MKFRSRVPVNWLKLFLATIAGIFHGLAWREGRRVGPGQTLVNLGADEHSSRTIELG
jgi:hypothetical protein